MISPNCYHQCSGSCRRVGCNCECGEFHDTYEPDEDEPRGVHQNDRVFTTEQLAVREERQ